MKTIRQGYCIPNYFEFKGNHAKASDTLVIQYFQYLNTDAKCYQLNYSKQSFGKVIKLPTHDLLKVTSSLEETEEERTFLLLVDKYIVHSLSQDNNFS